MSDDLEKINQSRIMKLESQIEALEKKVKRDGKETRGMVVKVQDIASQKRIEIREQIAELHAITDAQVIINKYHSTMFNRLEEVLREFMKRVGSQLNGVEKPPILYLDLIKKLDSDSVQNRIDRLDAGFKVLKEHEKKGFIREKE